MHSCVSVRHRKAKQPVYKLAGYKNQNVHDELQQRRIAKHASVCAVIVARMTPASQQLLSSQHTHWLCWLWLSPHALSLPSSYFFRFGSFFVTALSCVPSLKAQTILLFSSMTQRVFIQQVLFRGSKIHRSVQVTMWKDYRIAPGLSCSTSGGM